MIRIYLCLVIAFILAPWSHADTLVGIPAASGPGLGSASLAPAPPAGTPTWFMGVLSFDDNSWVVLDLPTVPSAAPQTISVLLILTNSSGTNFDEFHFWLSGSASFSYDPGLPPTSLLPLGGPPIVTDPTHLSFEPAFWAGNDSTNTISFNLVVSQQAQGESVSLRVGSVPEPGSGLALLSLFAVTFSRGRRD